VHDFLALEIAELDEATQRELFSHLEIASEQLKASDRGTLSAVNQTRIELNTKIDQIGVVNPDLLDQMRSIQQEVILQAARVTDAEQAVLEAKDAIDAKTAEFDASYLVASQEIDQVQLELTEFRTQRTDLTQAIDAVKDDVAMVKLDIVNLDTTRGGG
jgi:chromosome segregation ATPase